MGRTYLYVACEIKKRDGDVGLAQVHGRQERGRLGEQQKDVAGVEREVSTCYFRTRTSDDDRSLRQQILRDRIYRCGPLPMGGAGPAYCVTATPLEVDTLKEVEEVPIQQHDVHKMKNAIIYEK